MMNLILIDKTNDVFDKIVMYAYLDYFNSSMNKCGELLSSYWSSKGCNVLA